MWQSKERYIRIGNTENRSTLHENFTKTIRNIIEDAFKSHYIQLYKLHNSVK